MVFIPRANAGNRPAMVVELKYNQSADSTQIDADRIKIEKVEHEVNPEVAIKKEN